MPDSFEQNLRHMQTSGATAALHSIRRGIEKESLRIDRDGILAATLHPAALGAALTHPYITTDYSEALLEFVTPVATDIGETLACLRKIHAFTHQNIGDEKLWVCSMPCIVRGEQSIPIASYGTSNVGIMKHVYRRGLGHRYGRLMQTIAGIHYNFSLPDVFWDAWLPWGARKEYRQDLISERYMGAIRNFHRHCWLLFYLFGASPAVCKSFVAGRNHGLVEFDPVTLHAPHATSLRMSDLGYQNPAQAEVNICYNSLTEFVTSLRHATNTPYPPYQAIGIKVDGEYRQLNANLLQIENEYYAVIRPKRIAHSGEKPSHALATQGVEYIEVRCLDLNPFLPVGIDAETCRFVDLFLLYCLFSPSAPLTAGELAQIDDNKARVALRGREPGLTLHAGDTEATPAFCAATIIDQLDSLATQLDGERQSGPYHHALEVARRRLADPDTTPSAAMLAEMRDHDESFVEFALRQSARHERTFRAHPINPSERDRLTRLAAESIDRQRQQESVDQVDFDTFLADYLRH